MRLLTPHQFFNLNWFVSNPELTSLKPAQNGEPALAIGYVWFHVQDEVNGGEPDEDMMCAVFPGTPRSLQPMARRTFRYSPTKTIAGFPRISLCLRVMLLLHMKNFSLISIRLTGAPTSKKCFSIANLFARLRPGIN